MPPDPGVGEHEAGHLVGMLDATWSSFASLLRELDAPAWELGSDCPGWTVHDLAAHIVGVESMMSGVANPEVPEQEWPHVRNEFGRLMEPWVEHYRSRPHREVLDDFVAITAARIAYFEGLDDAAWAGETFTPLGPGTYADLVSLRLFDSWAHEQDARRVVGRPGNFDTDVGRWCVERCSQPLARIVAREVGAPDGTTVTWQAYGPPVEHRWTVTVADGRGHVGDEIADPSVRIITDVVTFVRLGLGRVGPDAAFGAGLVALLGDEALGRRVVHAMAFTP